MGGSIKPSRVLLTGATGFVGHLLEPVLRRAGHEVLCATRDVAKASRKWPGRTFIRCDLDDRESVLRAMESCEAAYYLVHSISRDPSYPLKEAMQAEVFAKAARAQGLRRVVYLGGVAPHGRASRHLRSRLHTGHILRAELPNAIELRAAMIVGEGSASWTMVLELSARLPAMVLPKWTQLRSAPVAIDDVLYALLRALDFEVAHSTWMDVPGPEIMTHEEMLRRVARVLGKHPPMMRIPLLSPALSSYWVALVTSVDLDMAHELVAGLQCDLVPSGESVWNRIHDREPLVLEDAARLALEAQQAHRALERKSESGATRSTQTWRRRLGRAP
jgi:uncharacterized protein YbjT (DUF2867 family)